ncbi:cell division protein FtsW [Candidatus Giovannonibacteria bacterium]|nr:cell division protein FtsW [Candidatus Giovannonibacteria bacterium]
MRADPILKGIIIIFLLLGFFILASASIGITAQMKLPPYFFIFRQAVTGGLMGLALFLFAYKTPYKRWKNWSVIIFVLSLLLTAAVFIPQISFITGGARRWISIGPLNFQPAELLKFGFILYLAAWFSSGRRKVSSLKEGLIPFLVITAVASILLFLQPDIGTLGVVAFSGLFLFLIAGAKYYHILALIVLGLVLLGVIIYLAPYRVERLQVFLHPEYDPQGSGYQVRQAVIAIGSGGIFGRGFGMSRQKFQYLPEPVGDSIFAVAAEEFGFIGSALMVLLFMIFAWRGFYLSRLAPDNFGKLFGSGIVLLIIIQSLINMSALSGIAPLTGIPLAFISQGGSALAMTLLEVGILLNISRSS